MTLMFYRRLILPIAFVFVGTLCPPASAQSVRTGPPDRPLTIKKKPRPSAGNCRYGNGPTSGTSIFSVVFERSGIVTEVTMLTGSGCNSFDRSAEKAARKIKFEPAVKNGAPVTIKKKVEYSYTIY